MHLNEHSLTPMIGVGLSCLGVILSGLGIWTVRTLHNISQVAAVLVQRVNDHEDKHDSHEARGVNHERRIGRIEKTVKL